MQTLNLENFEMTMFMIIRAANYGAAAYFLCWIVLGKFILLALFLAVMLEAFENKYQVGCGASRWAENSPNSWESMRVWL
jgi:hypothetical protein